MSAPMAKLSKKYIFHFAHEHVEFRKAELSSILRIFNIQANIPDQDIQKPFFICELPSIDDALKVASRSVLIRSIYEFWCEAKSFDGLLKAIRELPSEFLEPYCRSEETFRFQVTTFNKSLTEREKIDKIERLPADVLDFHGKVNLKKAVHKYHILEYYGPFATEPSDQPLNVYMGKWIADGQRDIIREYHLQHRHFIANTSMDAGLSMIMANMGKVQPNTLVLDPFVGSGSILVAAAHFGAYVTGTDIDYPLLHAKARPSRCKQTKRAPDEGIYSNLKQYGTQDQYIDAIIADASQHDLWRHQTLFDAIITDPPYGIREGARKVGTDEESPFIDENLKDNHHPKQLDYNLSDIFKDLLNFSAKYLHKGGRLVYWFPVSRLEYRDENVPKHTCLRLMSNCEQPMNTKVSRRLITMEKVMEYEESVSDAEVKVDHFETSTFREKYFRSNKSHSDPSETSAVATELQTLTVNDT